MGSIGAEGRNPEKTSETRSGILKLPANTSYEYTGAISKERYEEGNGAILKPTEKNDRAWSFNRDRGGLTQSEEES